MKTLISGHSQILKDIAGYSTSAVLGQALGLISGFVVARLLGPSNFGVWNAVSLVLAYGAYSEAGILSAMGRDLPFYLGQGDFHKAQELENAGVVITLAGGGVVALVVLGLSFWPGCSSLMALGLRGMAMVLVLQQAYTYHRTVLRSYNEFGALSRQQVLLAVLNATLAIALVAGLGFAGRVAAAILAQAAILFYAVRLRPWKAISIPNWQVGWHLARVGLPILISGFILSLLATVDRLIVITFLGETQLGYFGLALILASIVSLIPTMASQVLYPRITYRYGETNKDIHALRPFVLIPPIVFSCLLPLLIGPLYLALPLMIKTFLPAYVPGIGAMRILLLGIFFFSILGLTDYLLVVIGKLKQLMLFGCLALTLDIVLDLVFIRLGFGIEGIALGGTLITYFCYACVIIGYALSHYTRQLGDWVRYFSKLFWPYAYMVGLLFLLERWGNLPGASGITGDVLTVGLQMVLFGLGCLPLVYAASRELKLEWSLAQLVRLKGAL